MTSEADSRQQTADSSGVGVGASKEETGRKPETCRPSRIQFGEDTFDEPHYGLGLLLYPDGVRLYGRLDPTRGDRHPRFEPKKEFEGDGTLADERLEKLDTLLRLTALPYVRTPFVPNVALRSLFDFFAACDPKTTFRLLGQDGFQMRVYRDGEHRRRLDVWYAGSFSSPYAAENESLGPEELHIVFQNDVHRLLLSTLSNLVEVRS